MSLRVRPWWGALVRAAGVVVAATRPRGRGAVRQLGLLAVMACTIPMVTASATPMQTGAAGEQRASRVQLTTRADSLDRLLAAGTVRPKDKIKVMAELSELRRRLAEGDFQVGDRFLFTVVGDNVLSDSGAVREDHMVSVSALPELSVKGVLRSELTETLSAHVARYLKNTTVRTIALSRISIIGAVARQGFYYVAPDRPVSEAIMLAGGPTERTNLNAFEVKRNGEVIISTKTAQAALRTGRTFEQLDIRSGDEIRIPAKNQRRINWSLVLQFGLIVSSVLLALTQFITWYYRE
jgi:protein involved in polysaccharide export with SLBB domain